MRKMLQGNKTTRSPECHIFLDTEATPSTEWTAPGSQLQVLKCWVASWVRLRDGEVVQERTGTGTDTDSWWTWLHNQLDPRRGTIVWAHGADYDWTTLRGWQLLELGQLTRKLIVCDGGIWIFKGKLRDKRLTWYDSCNWLRAPLDDVADWLGMTRPQLPAASAALNDWQLRCSADVAVLRAAILRVLRWHRENDLGCLRATVAGQSLQAWMHRLAPRVSPGELPTAMAERAAKRGRHYVYPIVHQVDSVLRFERLSYYGPTEITYRVGRVDQPIYCLDVQAAYPSIMGENRFPAQYLSRVDNPSPARLRELLDDYAVIASVRVRGTDCEVPCRVAGLPERRSGDVVTILPGPELIQLLDRGCVDFCWVAALYRPMRLFSAWTSEVCRLRSQAAQNNDRLCQIVAKCLANSLHGKFGQLVRGWQPTKIQRSDWLWGVAWSINAQTGACTEERSVGGWIDQRGEPEESAHSFPAIPAYVTSYARLHMARLRQLAGSRETYYVYCDSLHVSELGYRRLDDAGEIWPGQPGKLKVESVYDWAHYYAPGRYEASDARHCSGLPRKHRVNAQGELESDHFATATETMCQRLVDGKPLPGVLVTPQTYRLDETAGGRVIGPDGWTTCKRGTIADEVPF